MRGRTWISVAAWVALVVEGQDMRENAVGCGDTLRTCEMDCLLPKFRANVALAWPYTAPESYTDEDLCLTSCKQTRQTCVLGLETKNSLACLETCATSYDAGMLGCQQMQSTTSKMSYAKNLDACTISESATMDSCTELCYMTDAYLGWTPEGENGEHVESLAKFTPKTYLAKVATHQASVSASASAPEGSLGSLGLYRVEGSASPSSSGSSGMLSVVGLAGLAVALVASSGAAVLRQLLWTTPSSSSYQPIV